jgi:hypothetical protein
MRPLIRPKPTRAFFRGRSVARFNDEISSIQSDEIVFENQSQLRRVVLPEAVSDARLGCAQSRRAQRQRLRRIHERDQWDQRLAVAAVALRRIAEVWVAHASRVLVEPALNAAEGASRRNNLS